MMIPAQNLAVVARRYEPADSLDYFPTAPWATRALLRLLKGLAGRDELDTNPHFVPHYQRVLDPCCGQGHMAGVLKETFGQVLSLDVHDYGYGGVRDFIHDDDSLPLRDVDWVIMNPPFGLLGAFFRQALLRANSGVAVLCRTQALEGINRHRELWGIRPPTLSVTFAERLPLYQGRWVVNGSTATSYTWMIWIGDALHSAADTRLRWFAPGTRALNMRPDDPVRFNGVYQLRTLISKPKARKKKWKTTFHSPAEWALMGRAA